MSNQLTEEQYNRIIETLKRAKHSHIQIKQSDSIEYMEDVCIGLIQHSKTAIAAQLYQCIQS